MIQTKLDPQPEHVQVVNCVKLGNQLNHKTRVSVMPLGYGIRHQQVWPIATAFMLPRNRLRNLEYRVSKRHGNGLMENWTEQPVFLQRRRLLFWRTGQICQTYNFFNTGYNYYSHLEPEDEMFQLLLITGQRGNLVHCTVKQSNTSQHVRNGACATWAKPSTYELCACATERKTNIINNYPQHMRSAHTPRGRHVSKTRTIYAREIRTYHVVGKWAKPEPSIQEQYARTTWS